MLVGWLVQLCLSVWTCVGRKPFGDVSVDVGVLCRGHARTSSDSEYVAESRAPAQNRSGLLCTHISPIAVIRTNTAAIYVHDSWSTAGAHFPLSPPTRVLP